MVRSALIELKGTVAASKSSGIAQANVESPVPGVICIKGLDPAPVSAVATIAFGADIDSRIYVETDGPFGCQVEVETRNGTTTRTPEPFQVLVH